MGDLSLRVSVATLARVTLRHPQDGTEMLALERKATLIKSGPHPQVRVRAQPFGGAIRLRDPSRLRAQVGDFRFDSRRSQDESDFRILVRPSDWPAVRDFCIRHLQHPSDPALETEPDRELIEEFYDTLGVRLAPNQYTAQPLAILVENRPERTENIHASGYPTARIYWVFEVKILDDSLAQAMIENSTRYRDPDLHQLTLRNAGSGRPGRANAILTLPLKMLTDRYLAIPPEKRGEPLKLDNHLLDGNVPAVLADVPVPKYRRL
jgi:hypothetical protein